MFILLQLFPFLLVGLNHLTVFLPGELGVKVSSLDLSETREVSSIFNPFELLALSLLEFPFSLKFDKI